MISIFNLPIIYGLFDLKEKELKSLAGNLQLNQVKEDAAFATTVEKIKQQILLKPVVFKQPSISQNYYQTEKTMPATYQNPWPHQKQVYVITVEFPFDGSSELFSYSPNNARFGGSSTRVHQPAYGNILSVEVELEQLNKEQAIGKAQQILETTFSLIEQINPQAEQWSQAKEPQIDTLLQQKRQEIINFLM